MSRLEKHFLEFGPFRLDASEHTVLRDGRPVPLRPKVFDVLLLLVERHGRLVGKDELMRAVWPDQFVEEGNLNKTISMLRQALGESETGPRYIDTVPKRGYRFVADVREVDRVGPEAGTAAGDGPGLRRSPPWYLAAAGVVIALAAVAYVFYPAGGSAEAIDSVAVMPFVNDSQDPQAEYLSDGITESLISSLSRLGNLKVMSRNTVFRFKGQAVDARQAGQALGVRSVLMGNLKQVDDQLAINVELIDARDGSVIWTRQYVRKMAGVMALPTSVAEDIAANLRVKSSGPQQPARRYTDNVEAYELYLKGRHFWNRNKRTPEDFRKSLEYFQRAIDLDPAFALAYVGLADCYNMQTLYSEIPSSESVPLAKAAVMKALQLDDTLSEAHAALGWIKFAYEWDWSGAETAFQRALQLNPNHALAHNFFGGLLAARGRFDEAIAEKRAALELDPLSSPIRASLGWVLYFARRYDSAIEECREALVIEEEFFRAHLYLGLAYEQKGMHEQAIVELKKALSLSGGSVEMLSAMAHVYAASGNAAEAQRILARLSSWSKERHVDPYAVALIHAGLGQNDHAFEWLEKALRARSIMLVWLEVEPRLDGIRGDPRYQDLVRRVRLPQ
jgi:TolB-like protein/DNA-binding winged helix-turn-helix (wHTH) protein/Tfp pilus assembly protein PilF